MKLSTHPRADPRLLAGFFKGRVQRPLRRAGVFAKADYGDK